MAIPPSLDSQDHLESHKVSLRNAALWLVLSLVITALLSQVRLDFIESYLYDLRVRLRPAPASTDHIELVLIDPRSIEALRTSPGFKQHREFIERLAVSAPHAIVYDVQLSDIVKDGGEVAFAQAAEKSGRFYWLTDNLEMRGEEGRMRLPPPFADLRVVSGPKSSDSKNFAKDGVTRRFLIDYQGRLMLPVQLAQMYNPQITDAASVRGSFDFLGTQQSYINFRPPGSYPSSSFADVLEGRVDSARFKDKIVIVGLDTQMSERDYAATPYARDVVNMTSAEVQANTIETLIRNDAPVRSNRVVDFLLIFLVSALTVYVVFSATPGRGLLILGATLLVFAALAFFAFWPMGMWVTMAHPLIAVFICYYFFIPYRLIIENRRSWEIFQKHRLLKQLEELKTNFISMMSHDLKTPIARIQGMVDIIQRNPSPLANEQREALDTIRHSSEDLLRFINAILQYGKIEAQQIQLHRQSKDVNTIVRDVVKRHEFLAKIKRISIRAELETLFPISLDPELMQLVFSNLLENAIKYSPEDSRVLITSEESGGFVVIQFADQGQGIPNDELPHIFMKFFRSNNAKSSPIKGSGLGLYLARYFTELHGGRISVESSYGQGSTFTVELPLQNR